VGEQDVAGQLFKKKESPASKDVGLFFVCGHLIVRHIWLPVLMEIDLALQQDISATGERLIGELYAEFLGSSFESIHIGRNLDESDCLILFEKNEYSKVEISSDTDFDQQLAQSHINSVIQDLVFEDETFGGWSLTIPAGKSSKKFINTEIIKICRELAEIERNCSCTKHAWNCESKSSTLKKYGLHDARRFESEKSRAYLFLDSTAHQIRRGPEILFNYLEQYFCHEKIIDKVGRLIKRVGELKRTYLILANSGTDRNLYFTLCFNDSEEQLLPSAKLTLPQGLNSVAVICYGSGKMLHFSDETGWSKYTPDRNVWEGKIQQAMRDVGHPMYQNR
jgi:hypothetical protein